MTSNMMPINIICFCYCSCEYFVLQRYVLGAFVNWEILALTCGFLPLVFLVLMIFMPESPRYFLIKNNVTEAKEALRWLRGADNVEVVEEELQMASGQTE